jgi:hypothetical protein
MEANAVETIAGVIQLSVAPVFLLAGIAGMLNVLSVTIGPGGGSGPRGRNAIGV